ncbi:hypothetical protein BaRGS_00011128, partial [Batillaria attramentaria]
AFLIPFLVSLMLCGLPLYFLETSIGQFTTRGAFHVWSFCPIMKGAGIGMLALSVIFFWYYNTIMAWALYYAVASCQSVVPWSRCDGWWNTPNCMVRSANASVGAANDSLSGSSVTMSYLSNVTTGETETNAARATMNISDDNVGATKLVSAAEEFWQHNALQVSSGMGEPGDVVWYLVLALVVSLLFIFCALVKGVKSAGKNPRDSVLLTFLCEGTSVYGGFAIFAVLGYMANVAGLTIDKVVSSETVITALLDFFPRTLPRYRVLVTALFCALFFVAGLPFVTQVILVFLLTRYKPPTYGDYEYDEWASVFGWIIATVSFVPIPVVAVYQLYHAQGSFLQ